MKRTLCLFLTGALLAASGTGVLAESSMLKTNTLQDVNLVYNTNLLRKQGNNGYSLASLDGTALTGEIYSDFTSDQGYIIAAENKETMHRKGVLSQNGKEIVPCKYSEIDVLNEHWILGIMLKEATGEQYDFSSWDDEHYYLIETVDVYYAADDAGKCLTTLTREQYIEARAYDAYINIQDRSTNAITTYDSEFNAVATVDNIYDEEIQTGDRFTFDSNGQEGLMDAEGNIIMEASFKYIYDFYYDNYAEVSTGDLTGLIDYDGNVVVPAEYERIDTSYNLPARADGDTSGYNANGYFAVVKDGKLGYVDASGTVTCEPKYSNDIMDNQGASALFTDMEGNTRILAADGTETVVSSDYEDIYAMSYGSGMYYRVTDADYNYGLIDWHGQELFPCEYAGFDFSADGKYLIVELNDYTTVEIYQMPEITAAAPAESAEADVQTPAESTEDDAQAPAESTEDDATDNAADTSGNTAAVTALIDSAITLLNAGSSNDAVTALLNEAVTLLGDSNASATVLLNTAITQLGSGTDAAGVVAILESIAKLM